MIWASVSGLLRVSRLSFIVSIDVTKGVVAVIDEGLAPLAGVAVICDGSNSDGRRNKRARDRRRGVRSACMGCLSDCLTVM